MCMIDICSAFNSGDFSEMHDLLLKYSRPDLIFYSTYIGENCPFPFREIVLQDRGAIAAFWESELMVAPDMVKNLHYPPKLKSGPDGYSIGFINYEVHGLRVFERAEVFDTSRLDPKIGFIGVVNEEESKPDSREVKLLQSKKKNDAVLVGAPDFAAAAAAATTLVLGLSPNMEQTEVNTTRKKRNQPTEQSVNIPDQNIDTKLSSDSDDVRSSTRPSQIESSVSDRGTEPKANFNRTSHQCAQRLNPTSAVKVCHINEDLSDSNSEKLGSRKSSGSDTVESVSTPPSQIEDHSNPEPNAKRSRTRDQCAHTSDPISAFRDKNHQSDSDSDQWDLKSEKSAMKSPAESSHSADSNDGPSRSIASTGTGIRKNDLFSLNFPRKSTENGSSANSVIKSSAKEQKHAKSRLFSKFYRLNSSISEASFGTFSFHFDANFKLFEVDSLRTCFGGEGH